MIAHAVDLAVGVGGDAGGCEGDQRADGGCAGQRDFVEEVLVDVGVGDWVSFDEVARGSSHFDDGIG